MSEKRTVLITGVSSGIGQATAGLLARGGYIVFGASRNPASTAPIPGVEMLPLDICSDGSVRACIDALLARVAHLDVLVNNAGYALRGALEEVTLQEAKAQFETNLFGVARMTKGVLPVMRKRGLGQIINISSAVGLAALPFVGFYSASKFALEGYTEALRQEVKPFNIQVSLVEPASVKTRFWTNQQEASEKISDYDPWRKRLTEVRQQLQQKAIEPTSVAETILRIIESKSPRLRHPVGSDAVRIARMRRLLPEAMFEKGMRRRLRLDIEK
jgi:short-subunit dehydrogenase